MTGCFGRILPIGILGALAGAGTAGQVQAANLIDVGSVVGSAKVDGAYFFPLLTSGTTITAQAAGTGIFNPFLQYQNNGSEEGFNTSSGSGPLDDKAINSHTKDITVSVLNTYTYNSVVYYAFGLDINEAANTASTTQSLDKLQVWVRSTPLVTPTVYTSLSTSGATKVWDLDGAQDNTLLLDYNLTGSGSGVADYLFLIPKTTIDNAVSSTSWNVYFYAQQGAAGTVNGKDYTTDGGFEEWSIVSGFSSLTPPPVVPEKSTYAAGIFMAGAAWATWRRNRRKTPPAPPGPKGAGTTSTAPRVDLEESAFALIGFVPRTDLAT